MFLRPKYLSLNEIRSNFAPRSGVIHGKGNASWSGTKVTAILSKGLSAHKS